MQSLPSVRLLKPFSGAQRFPAVWVSFVLDGRGPNLDAVSECRWTSAEAFFPLRTAIPDTAT